MPMTTMAGLSTTRLTEPPNHLALHSPCGICAGAVVAGDTIVGLLGNEDSSGLDSHTPAVQLPQWGDNDFPRTNDRLLCNQVNCAICYEGPETATLHAECFGRFRQLCTADDGLDRLWRTAAWRRPWRDANVGVLEDKVHFSHEALAPVATECGLKLLASMPHEIVRLVRGRSPRAPFWRVVAASELAMRLSLPLDAVSSGEPRSFAARDIVSWERGGELKVSEGGLKHLKIRVTIDSCGLQKFETLEDSEMCYSPRRYDHLAYAVIEQSHFSRVMAQYQDGQLRLRLQPGQYHFDIWDTPAPPCFDAPTSPHEVQCVYTPLMALPTRLATIDLTTVTGLTFFMNEGGATMDIHGHTAEKPFASIPHDMPESEFEEYGHWIYVPLPPEDEVLAFATRGYKWPPPGQPSFLLRTKLAGDIAFGPWFPPSSQPTQVSETPNMIIYGRSGALNGEATGMGFSPRTAAGIDDVFPRRSYSFVPEAMPTEFGDESRECYFSCAPLSGAKRATVFWRTGLRVCRGILLEYEKGAQRTVGDVRLGADASDAYEDGPRRMCTKMVPYDMPRWQWQTQALGYEVVFSREEECEARHARSGWVCHDMEGVLNFWFSMRENYIEVVGTAGG